MDKVELDKLKGADDGRQPLSLEEVAIDVIKSIRLKLDGYVKDYQNILEDLLPLERKAFAEGLKHAIEELNSATEASLGQRPEPKFVKENEVWESRLNGAVKENEVYGILLRKVEETIKELERESETNQEAMKFQSFSSDSSKLKSEEADSLQNWEETQVENKELSAKKNVRDIITAEIKLPQMYDEAYHAYYEVQKDEDGDTSPMELSQWIDQYVKDNGGWNIWGLNDMDINNIQDDWNQRFDDIVAGGKEEKAYLEATLEDLKKDADASTKEAADMGAKIAKLEKTDNPDQEELNSLVAKHKSIIKLGISLSENLDHIAEKLENFEKNVWWTIGVDSWGYYAQELDEEYKDIEEKLIMATAKVEQVQKDVEDLNLAAFETTKLKNDVEGAWEAWKEVDEEYKNAVADIVANKKEGRCPDSISAEDLYKISKGGEVNDCNVWEQLVEAALSGKTEAVFEDLSAANIDRLFQEGYTVSKVGNLVGKQQKFVGNSYENIQDTDYLVSWNSEYSDYESNYKFDGGIVGPGFDDRAKE